MYRELTAADHQRMVGLSAGELPHVLALVGVFDIAEGARRWASYLEEPQFVKRFPSWVARHGALRVAVATAFGGPMAAMHAHTWLAAGVPIVLQLGWAGALQPGSKLGEVYVPRHAERQDGVSDWYLPKGIMSDATPGLADAIASRMRGDGIAVNEHGIFSTPALLAESREVIADWNRHGYAAVDMETATTFSVAKSLSRPRAAALMRLDDLIAEEHSLAGGITREERAYLRGREEVVMKLALDATAEWAEQHNAFGSAGSLDDVLLKTAESVG